MSPESLAANGDSLRAKVFFVASSLLEKYPSTTEGHSYVSDFLNVVSTPFLARKRFPDATVSVRADGFAVHEDIPGTTCFVVGGRTERGSQ